MRLFSAGAILLLALLAVGCGSGAQGPAKPEDTPVVTQEELEKKMTTNIPPEAKAMYDKYKKGK